MGHDKKVGRRRAETRRMLAQMAAAMQSAAPPEQDRAFPFWEAPALHPDGTYAAGGGSFANVTIELGRGDEMTFDIEWSRERLEITWRAPETEHADHIEFRFFDADDGRDLRAPAYADRGDGKWPAVPEPPGFDTERPWVFFATVRK